MANTMPRFTPTERIASIHHRPRASSAQCLPHAGTHTYAIMFCHQRLALCLLLTRNTHDNGGQAHRKGSPEHSSERMSDRRVEDALVFHVSSDIPEGEQAKHRNVQDENDCSNDP